MKLAIIYTGGTIGCFYKPLRPMTNKEFGRLFDCEAVPVLKSKFAGLQVFYLEYPGDSLDSTDINPEHWCIIVDLILSRFGDYDAFLVLHGTDTMAYTAGALSFLFTAIDKAGHRVGILNKPIVLTGSQLPLFHGDSSSAQLLFNTDAFQNLCGAVECIYRGIPKVCLFFNNKLFLGTRAKKTSSNQFDAFVSPNHPPLVQIGIETSLDHAKIRPDIRKRTVLLSSSPEARERLQSQTEFMKQHLPSVRIAVFEAYPGRPELLANQLEAVLQLDDPEQQLEGLIIEAYGAGNLPSGNPADPLKGKVYQILARAKERGIIIVNNTKCLSGMVNSNAYASGSWLASIEVVSAYDMTSVAIYTKLLYVLALAKRHNWSQPMIRKVLSTNLCSDMVDVHCLDSMGQRSLWPGESLASRDGTARLTNDLFRGPQLVLMDQKTGQWDVHPVWSAIDHPVGLSCVLRMQENGNLTFRDKALHVLWQSGTTEADDPYCRLELVGSTEPEGPALFVYNYMTNRVTRKLYPKEADDDDEAPSHKRRKTVA